MTRSAWPSRTWPTAASRPWSATPRWPPSTPCRTTNYKGKLKIVGQPFTEEYYGVAVKKGNSKVLEAINKGLKKVLEHRRPTTQI